jgi:hypothetical protein
MILIGLPVDPESGDKANSGSELILPGSEAGFRLQTLINIHLSRRMNFKVSFPTGTDFETFRVEAEIVWKDVYSWEDWKGYQYALKFVESLNGHYLKLKRLFCQLSGMAETSLQMNHSGDPV